jgi:hypothetical protein
MTPRIQTVILSARQAFTAQFGREPNTILVSSNGEMALNELRVKPGSTYMNMTVVSAEIVDDATVALLLKPK